MKQKYSNINFIHRPSLPLPPTSGEHSYEGRDATRQPTSFDPATTPNLAYDDDTNNGGTYDYVA